MLKVQDVIEQIARDSSFIAVREQIGQDWERGHKGILKDAVQRKVQKPKLVLDPEDRMYL